MRQQGETAKTLSERFGKVLQKRQSMTINRNDTSTSISTQLDSLIPASKIANLTQGMFVGAVSDNFDEGIDQKIPEVLSFTDANGNDTTKEQVEANYRQIKLDVIEIIEREKERIANDPELRHLVEKEGE